MTATSEVTPTVPVMVQREPPLRFVNVVWGTSFTRAFLDVCLPSQVSPENLGYCGREHRSLYTIYTTAVDAEVIRSAPVFRAMERLLPVEIKLVEEVVTREAFAASKHLAMTACHADAIRTAPFPDCAFVFLAPDTVWAEGSLRNVARHAERGKRLVVMNGLRLEKEPFIEELLSEHGGPDGLRPIPPRELVRLGLRHLHADTRSLMWGERVSNTAPSLLLWPVGDEGLLVRGFHMHPILVRPAERDVLPQVTIDDDYVLHACPHTTDLHVVTDSDDVLTFEFTSADDRWQAILPWPQTVHRVAAWAQVAANARHRELVSHVVRVHDRDLGEKWRVAEVRSDAVVSRVRALIDDPMGSRIDVKARASILLGHPAGAKGLAETVHLVRLQLRPSDEVALETEAVAEATSALRGAFGRRRLPARIVANAVRQYGDLLQPARQQTLAGDYVLPVLTGDDLEPGFLDRAVRLLSRCEEAAVVFSDGPWIERSRQVSPYGSQFECTRPRFLSPREMVTLILAGSLPRPPFVFRRQALTELPDEVGRLGPYGAWFSWLVLAFRHGACFVPAESFDARRSLAPESDGIPPQHRESAFQEMLDLLRAPSFADVLPLFVDASAFATLGGDAMPQGLRWPESADATTWALLGVQGGGASLGQVLDRAMRAARIDPQAPTRAVPPVEESGWTAVRSAFHNWWGLHRKNARVARVWWKRSLVLRMLAAPVYDVARFSARGLARGKPKRPSRNGTVLPPEP